jgi:hypothetical protein
MYKLFIIIYNNNNKPSSCFFLFIYKNKMSKMGMKLDRYLY